MDKVYHYLGMNINRKCNIITIFQPGYIKAILKAYAPTKKLDLFKDQLQKCRVHILLTNYYYGCF